MISRAIIQWNCLLTYRHNDLQAYAVTLQTLCCPLERREDIQLQAPTAFCVHIAHTP